MYIMAQFLLRLQLYNPYQKIDKGEVSMILGGFKVLKKEATKADALFLFIFMLIILFLGMFLEAEGHILYDRLTADQSTTKTIASKTLDPIAFGDQNYDWCYFVDEETKEVYIAFKAGLPGIGFMPAKNADGTVITFDQISDQKYITGDISTIKRKFSSQVGPYFHPILNKRFNNN
jgi:hypothetical protein